MRFAGNVARMGDKRGAYRFWGRGHFEDLGLDGRIKLKCLLICSIFRVLIRFVKCINNQQIHINFMMYFYLQYVLQHVSANNPAIFRVMIQEYNCS